MIAAFILGYIIGSVVIMGIVINIYEKYNE